jgi:riboflavin transporter FmnP
MKQTTKLNKLIKVSMLSAIGFILMMFNFPITLLFPDFLKVDVGDLPAIIGAFAMGPMYGVAIQAIKNLLHFLLQTSTGGIGELANFLVGSALVLPAGFIYMKDRSKKNAMLGLFVGIFSMAVMGALANYFILLPFYETFMPISIIVELAAKVTPLVKDKFTLVLFSIVPFNLFKGTLVSAITLLIYKRVSRLLV